MVRQTPLFFLFFLHQWLVHSFYCPLGSYQGSAFSGKLQAALGVSTISLSQEEQFFLYNYSMPFQLQIPPEIAVAVHDFEFQQSKHIFYYIKPIKTSSISNILFGIRINWGYTKWKRISFSFLAEDRPDLQSGYYMVDSGELSSCKMGKSIQTLLPFRTIIPSNSAIHHKLFLHGFQITTSLINNTTRSPFEIQIVSSFAKVQGIFVSLSATTETEINSIFISYIAYQQINLSIISGKYTYDSSIIGSKLHHSVQNPNQKSYSRIFGLTGFIIIYYSQRVIFSTKWDGSTFYFDLGIGNQYVKYLSYQYLFFTGSSCSQCNGYQIVYNYNCVNSCPLGTTLTSDLICIDCGQGRYFNGTTCVYKCLEQQKIDDTLTCNCPNNLFWDGQNCVPCSLGKTWNNMSKKCECLYPLIWDGFTCSRYDECKFGKIWDPYTYSCKCQQDSFWNSRQCQKLPQCQGGQILDMNTKTCKCPKNKIMINNSCDYTPCVGGQFWTGDACACQRGFNFNGQICIQCKNKQIWNNQTLSCQCQSGYQRNGKYCSKIVDCTQSGRTWDQILGQCMCPDKHYWFGSNCVPVQNCRKGQYFDLILFRCQCIIGQFWNGTMCIQCQNGMVWNKKLSLCYCPPGTELLQSRCVSKQACKGGKLWMQNQKACICPIKTAWNGTYCSYSACQTGKYWNSSSKSCVCGLNLVQVNEICLPQQRKCSNGQIWNKQLYSCRCHTSSWQKNQKCQTKFKCDNNKTLNPLNGICECPYGFKEINQNCTIPNCMKSYAWNGFQCEATICPSLFYFDEGRCVYGFQNLCGFSKYWNGKNCQQYPLNCPKGTKWVNFYCESVSKCPNGSYIKNQTCKPLPTKILKYKCPEGSINNGTVCIECGNGRKYTNQVGCECPRGQFDTGLSCEYISLQQCSIIENSIWTQQKCQCKSTFSQINLHCFCQGIIVNGICDRCPHRPNSVYNEEKKLCICKDNYILIQQKCIRLNTYSKGDEPSKCTVGTFYEIGAKMCLPCDLGCLSCFNSYKCRTCQPEFQFDHLTDRCFQLCGDGRKFYLGCDDGNNIDGDGCSRDCQVEQQYICTGGSPENPDICYIHKPKQINFNQTGQIRKQTSIIIYIRINYLPKSLLFSKDCGYKCSNILLFNITAGDKDIKSIKSELLIGNANTFMVKVQFGRNIFGKFTLKIGLNATIAKYFNFTPFIPLQINVQPKYLFQVNQF